MTPSTSVHLESGAAERAKRDRNKEVSSVSLRAGPLLRLEHQEAR